MMLNTKHSLLKPTTLLFHSKQHYIQPLKPPTPFSTKTFAKNYQEDSHPFSLSLPLFYTAGFQLLIDAISLPAGAQESEVFQGGFSKESYYVTLGLFVLSLPGLWSLIKRAPKAKIIRKTFEVEGPKVEGAVSLDSRARQIFGYFKNYNYQVKETGDVIVFKGTYQASRGQAAALVTYVFLGLVSTALVLSIAIPSIGNWWYSMTLLSPLAGLYYFQRGTREEEVRVKMITADNEDTTDIVIEGDQEEIERFRKELDLMEKGKVYVKGILEI